MKVLHSVLFVGAVGTAACSSHPPANDPSTTSSTYSDPHTTTVITASTAPAADPIVAPPERIPVAPDPAPSAQDGAAHAPTLAANTSTPPADTTPPPSSGTTQPDNSAVNQRDRGSSALTPMSQGGSESDRKTTQLIRRAVMKDSVLSFTAKNVKIITVNGKVTLRGPVKSEQERIAIEADAQRIVSNAQIDSQLEVKK